MDSQVEDELRSFRYIKIGREENRYFSLQESLIVVAWLLYIKKDSLRPNSWPPFFEFFQGNPIRWLKRYLSNSTKKFIVLMNFACCKYHLRKIEAQITVPFSGQICVLVHKGCKIFDLRKGVVVKVFDNDTEASMILEEVERLRQISQIPFAPSIRRWDIEGKWYEEDYVDGEYDNSNKPLDSKHVLYKFRNQLVPHMKTLVRFQKPTPRNVIEYVDEIGAPLYVNSLRSHKLSGRESNNIKGFVHTIADKLHSQRNHMVHLVFTHGDFCPANMLNAKDGIIVVDWESAKYRSALFDFYSYFFHRHACRDVPINNVVFEIKEALSVIISELTNEATGISPSLLNLEKVYRWIFYLEYVCRLVEREITDEDLDISRYLIGYIDAFKKYEETVANA